MHPSFVSSCQCLSLSIRRSFRSLLVGFVSTDTDCLGKHAIRSETVLTEIKLILVRSIQKVHYRQWGVLGNDYGGRGRRGRAAGNNSRSRAPVTLLTYYVGLWYPSTLFPCYSIHSRPFILNPTPWILVASAPQDNYGRPRSGKGRICGC
jgi:hypothetical protein